ncbi:MAG: hypothetical protein P4L81_07125 [Candidatus Pacebacteria bacterium]|nr:hypothetical protein [Candidatus Paceibacterota bacterium]
MIAKIEEFPFDKRTDTPEKQLRGSIGRTIHYLHQRRVDSARKPIEEMGGIDLIFEAVRENNPRGFNRKLMKQMRRRFCRLRKMERSMRRMHERIQGVRD